MSTALRITVAGAGGLVYCADENLAGVAYGLLSAASFV